MSQVNIERLRFEGLSFGFDPQTLLFEDVSFEFPLGDLVWIRADHGEGRSTLLQLLASLQTPTKGSYWINDQNVSEMSFEEFLPYRLKIGYGFDMGGLIHNRTLYENLILPLHYHRLISGKEASDRVLHLLEEFDVLRYKDVRPSFMPGGTRKLACMLRAIVHYPQMVLLDDPSVGIPQDTALQYFDLLQGLRQRGFIKHVFVSSFDNKFMSLLPHAEVCIDGRMLHSETESELKKVVNL